MVLELHCLFIVLVIVCGHVEASLSSPLFEGDPSCPCLLSPETGLHPIKPVDVTEDLISQLGNQSVFETYGIGCAAHDENTPHCTTDECAIGPNYLPAPIDCDRSYCSRQFCWVDPLNCRLLNRRSVYFSQSGRHYSYATCHDMDSFSDQYLLSSLEGKSFKVGFNSNSGGWTGGYSSTGEHFKGGIDKWSGPVVSFMRESALAGNFRLQLTEPPEFLRNRSVDFFGDSSFSYCVYATALGYLDLCVAQYSVTDKRATATDWFMLESEPLYLIVQTDGESMTRWQQFWEYATTISQPFTPGAWFFIIVFVIPVLGILFVYHEYGYPGSAFPRKEEVLVSEDHEQFEVKEHRIPLATHVVHSIYSSFLSVLQQAYGGSVVSIGSKWHMLGFAFFNLIIIAVYTANLAAILTQKAQATTVKSFEDALQRGYRLCGERTNIKDLSLIYGVDESIFVVDPPELGGDGKAGFTCSKCQSRTRVFEFLDVQKANAGDPLYCHAALAPLQDLQVLQSSGNHCNKISVGQPVRFIQSGFPVNEKISREIIALLIKMKNDGIYDRELIKSQPKSRCSTLDTKPQGSSLTIAELTGVWVVTFGFAFIAFLLTCTRPLRKKHLKRKEDHTIIKKVRGYDQHMLRTQRLERADSFLEENTELVDGKRMFVGVLDHTENVMRSSLHGSVYGGMGGRDSLSSHSSDGGPESPRKTFRRRPTASIQFSQTKRMLDGAAGSDSASSGINAQCATSDNADDLKVEGCVRLEV